MTDTNRAQIVSDIIDIIINGLNLHFLNRADINESTLLMAGGLGLDSVDILEVVVGVEQRYQVRIKNAEQGQQVFRSIGTIADFIQTHLSSTKNSPLSGNVSEQAL